MASVGVEFSYGDMFQSPYSFKNDYKNDYSQDFSTDFGGNADGVVEANAKTSPSETQLGTDQDPEEIPSWTEFTENTTFHGIKYIFQSAVK